MASWRPMTVGDLAEVERIGAVVHENYPEAPAVFADRLAICASACLMAEDDAGVVVGYCLAHPGVVGDPPPLDTVLGGVPAGADCLYIHDVALLPQARGLGLGAAIGPVLERVTLDLGYDCMALTSVSGSLPFWRKLGFVPTPCAKLASYGEATYCLRSVRP